MYAIIPILLVGIGALIGGYYFIKNFKKIDVKYFGTSSESYESFGFPSVIISALIGAVYGITLIFDVNIIEKVSENMGHAFILLLALNLYLSFARMESWKFRFAKFSFMVIACLIGALIGIIGSVIIICAIIIYIVVMLLFGSLRGSSVKGVVLDDGTRLERKTGLTGESYFYGKSDGAQWERSDTTFTKK